MFSLPLGVLLALGRRSQPADRQGGERRLHRIRARRAVHRRALHGREHAAAVPAGGLGPDRFVPPLVGTVLFAAAYMAEEVRGGLQTLTEANTRARWRSASAIGA